MKQFLRRLFGLETSKEFFERKPNAEFFITWEGRLVVSPTYIQRCIDKAIKNKININEKQ